MPPQIRLHNPANVNATCNLFSQGQEIEKDWKIDDGIIQDTSGDVIFKVAFKAISCMPEIDEVLDGKVVEVTSTGIQVQSGAIKCFISMKVVKLANFCRKTETSTNTTRPVISGLNWTSIRTRS
jgi:hypothetical protein